MRHIISMYMVNIPNDDTWPNEPNKFVPTPQVPNRGWECPKCGRCYAPWVPDCEVCGKVGTVAGVTTSTSADAYVCTGPGPEAKFEQPAEFVGPICHSCKHDGNCRAALDKKGQCKYWEAK